MSVSIKIDEEDYERLLDLRGSRFRSVRLVVKGVLTEKEALKKQVQALKMENDLLKNPAVCKESGVIPKMQSSAHAV